MQLEDRSAGTHAGAARTIGASRVDRRDGRRRRSWHSESAGQSPGSSPNPRSAKPVSPRPANTSASLLAQVDRTRPARQPPAQFLRPAPVHQMRESAGGRSATSRHRSRSYSRSAALRCSSMSRPDSRMSGSIPCRSSKRSSRSFHVLDAMPGGGTIRITAATGTGADARVASRSGDTGVGIPAHVMPLGVRSDPPRCARRAPDSDSRWRNGSSNRMADASRSPAPQVWALLFGCGCPPRWITGATGGSPSRPSASAP